jgi:hypothetical protein
VRAVSAPLRGAIVTVALSIVMRARAAAADSVVQLNVDAVLDGRSVSTVANGVVTTWSAGDGLDADDGFVTTAVEAILQTQGKTAGGKVGPALPDDGLFAANGQHPPIQLHFSNAAPPTSPQTHEVPRGGGAQTFMLDVPPATYSKVFLAITSSYGVGDLTVTLSYAGSAAPTIVTCALPDWGVGGAAAGDPVFFNLIQGLHKWTGTNQEVDTPTHGITGITLSPTPTATLTRIRVEKTNDAQVVFWGATGVATSAVTTDGGGAEGPTDARADDVGGGGASGSAGATAATDAGDDAATDATSPGPAGSGGGPAGAGGGPAGAGGQPASSGAAGASTTGPRPSGGGCALAPAPARVGGAASALLIAIGMILRRRRRA